MIFKPSLMKNFRFLLFFIIFILNSGYRDYYDYDDPYSEPYSGIGYIYLIGIILVIAIGLLIVKNISRILASILGATFAIFKGLIPILLICMEIILKIGAGMAFAIGLSNFGQYWNIVGVILFILCAYSMKFSLAKKINEKYFYD